MTGMLRIIAYDIASNRRLRKVAMICLDYGVRIEKSVFECRIDNERLDELVRRLKEAVNRNEDHFVVYSVCQTCEDKVIDYGHAEHANLDETVLVL